MGKNQEKFSNEQWQFLKAFKLQAELAEAGQVDDLIANCTNKYQFAKTYKTYEKDWELTKKQMYALKGEQAPKPHVLEEMIAIGEKLMQDKQERLRHHFQSTWHESIYNYVGGRPTIESLERMMEENGEKKKEQTAQATYSLNTVLPYLLGFLVFFVLVLLPALLHNL